MPVDEQTKAALRALQQDSMHGQQAGSSEHKPGWIARQVTAFDDWTHGRGDAEFDYPELPGTRFGKQSMGLDWKMAPAASNEERAQVFIKQTEGKIPVYADRFGVPYVDLTPKEAAQFRTRVPKPGSDPRNNEGISVPLKPGPYYLNRPGFSQHDIPELLFLGGAMEVAGGAVGAVTNPKSWLGRAGVGAIGGAGGEAARQAAARQMGAENNSNVMNMFWAGVGGAAGEAVLGPASKLLGNNVRSIYMQMTRSGRNRFFNPRSGKLTEEGVKFLSSQDIPPELINDAYAREFYRQALVYRNPAIAARAAQSQSLPVPFEERVSKLGGDVGLQRTEKRAEAGLLGPRSEEAADRAIGYENKMLRANADTIAKQISGTQDVPAINKSMRQAQATLAQTRVEALKGINKQYEAARAAGVTGLSGQSVKNLQSDMYGALEDFPDAVQQSIAADIKKLSDPRSLSEKMFGQTPEATQQVTINRVFSLRSALTEAQRSADPVQRRAATIAKQRLDDWLKETVLDDVKLGGSQAAMAWKKAISARREFGEVFEDIDIIDEMTKRKANGELENDPQDIADVVLGTSASGIVSRRGLTSSIRKAKKVMSPEEFNAVRGEVIARFFYQATSRAEGAPSTTYLFSGKKFLQDWNNFKLRNSDLVNELYTPDEIATLNNFARVAARTTDSVPGAVNNSGTAIYLESLMNQFRAVRAFAGNVPGAVDKILGGTTSKAYGELANRAPSLKRGYVGQETPRNPLTGLGGAIGGATEEDMRRRFRRREPPAPAY